MSATQLSISWDSFKVNLSHGFSLLQQNAEFVDMTLAAEGHFVKVHQNVLALASPYLKQMLLSVPSQHPVVFLNNVSHKILEYILEYIYTGEVTIPRDTLDAFIGACKGLSICGVEYFSFPEKVPIISKECISERSKQSLDHNYAAEIIIDAHSNNKENKTIFKNNTISEALPIATFAEDHEQVLLTNNFNKTTEDNLPDTVVNHLPTINQANHNFAKEYNLTVIQNEDLPIMHEGNLPVIRIDNVPVVNQEDMPVTNNLDLPILVEGIPIEPPKNVLPQDILIVVPPENHLAVPNQFNSIDYVQTSIMNENTSHFTPIDSSVNVKDNIEGDLSQFLLLNTDKTNNTVNKLMGKNDAVAGINKMDTKIGDNIPQFRVSPRGTLQLMLNRYLYHCHHQSCGGYKRRWRCIEYRKSHCLAVIDTVGDNVTNRLETHNHLNTNTKMINRFRKNMMFTKLSNAVNIAKDRVGTKKKRK